MSTDTVSFDLADVEFLKKPPEVRLAALAELRRLPGPVFFPEPKVPLVPRGKGFWALVRHADVVEASRTPEVFSSEPTATTSIDTPAYLAKYVGSMINMDDPRHAQIRRVVSRAFSPRMLARMEDQVQTIAEEIVDDLIARGPCDFVPHVAARLPIQVICDMMGIPKEMHERVFDLTNVMLGFTDPEYTGHDPDYSLRHTLPVLVQLVRTGRALYSLAMRLGKERQRTPTDDLTSALVNTNVDGESLTAQEFGSFFLLLVVAGNETTRNAIAHGLNFFTRFPDQRALLLEDFEGRIGTATEEIIRYSSPVKAFRRNVTRDHEMNGHTYRRGDKVMLYYGSANRDEAVFERPDEFDILRNPNPHVAFGGPGPHYCLGAHLARREITVMFRELFTRIPEIRAGEPEYLRSIIIEGVKHLDCDW
ncbi:MAG: cytochrome P450 [Streptosporangiales bacterium]|nr:cytochrome P450 [Streptosporangiales bacterium]